ncbi:bromodomain-containing protein 1 [Hibiscus trionum]|uniref:Bromodomain-containing protein 1 n=1 Tax=Hibiscus trionum TaxID=183268 RepID=A0A9W7LZV7_HIBTR|nr:bromodomain-containing protein 1 [Hibiscus trionum]
MGGGGEIAAETTTGKRKKKGRPSLLELQKRSLKQQLQEPQLPLQKTPNLDNPNSSNSTRRSALRYPSLNGGSPVSGGDDDDGENRHRKKHKLLLGFNSSRGHQHYPIPSVHNSASQSHGSDSNADGDEPNASLKRRKFTTVKPGSDQTEEKLSKVTDTLPGSPVESGPTTPLPDKKLLAFILDRLQKKDTYGVFSEPVDPEELPDYHDIIAHPMDFLTVRNKLDGGAYTTLEQFEIDVFLICSNAMQYNAPDTIYFRQARSIQELAKKDFENLRQDSDEGEQQPKVVRRGRPPGKSLKKSLVSSSFDRVVSEHPSEETLAAGRDASSLSNTYNLRKEPTSRKLWPADTLIRPSWVSPSKENYASSSEWENEFPASVVKAVMKYGMKHFAVDENRRDSYNHSLTSGHEQRLFSTLDGEVKQLVPVGLSAENGYATSLARFAANLGPVWKIASRKIGSVLPRGLKFGPGWVGENRMVEQPQCSFSNKQRSSNFVSDNPPGRFLSAATSISPLPGREDTETVRGLTSQNGFASAPSHQFQQGLVLHSGEAEIGPHAAPNVGLLPKSCNEQDFLPFPPDLNVRFLTSVSSSSSVPISSPQHPDLALQL